MLNTIDTPTLQTPSPFDPDGRIGLTIQISGLLDAAYMLREDGLAQNEAGNAIECTLDQVRTECSRLMKILDRPPAVAGTEASGGAVQPPSNGEAQPPRRHRDIESELMDLEGLAVSLKIVRFGDDCFRGLEHDYQHALETMIDTVLLQISKLSKAYRGEPLQALGYAGEGEDEEPADEGEAAGEQDAEEAEEPSEEETKLYRANLQRASTLMRAAEQGTTPPVPSQLMELFGRMTDKDLDKLCADDRARIGELCREWAKRAKRRGEHA